MNHAEANKSFLAQNNEGISANLLHTEENVKFYKFINNRAKVSLSSSNRVFHPKIERVIVSAIKGGHVIMR